jgi:3-phenylpropionate/cinnamic acid dioxygenase small subunit
MGLMTGAMQEQTDVRRHLISNIFFTQESGNPAVTSNLTLMATEDDEIKLLSAGIYHDVLEKHGDRWRILKRHLDLDKAY